jgi:hypothetical protein
MASQRFLDTNVGKIAVGALLIGAIGVAVWAFKNSFGTSSAVANANDRVFVDAKTGKPFNVDLKKGMTIPIAAPSGGNTGYPAEMCGWTKDGKMRSEPYPVLLNSWLGKTDPTFCPDCGRLVVGHNPPPDPNNLRPPPLQSEYKAKGSATDRD